MTTKFKKGQAVYIPSCKQCGIIILDDDANNRPEIQRMDGESVWYNYDMLRALHETEGFYVPEVGDIIPENALFTGGREIWERTVLPNTPIGDLDYKLNSYRFPLPPEALESEKWAREQEAKNSVTPTQPNEGEYSGHIICPKCGKTHWKYAGCESSMPSLGGKLPKEEKDNWLPVTEKQTWINWRPTSERPKVGEYVLIKDNALSPYIFKWTSGSFFVDSDIAWAPTSEFNEPPFPDPHLDLVRKLRSCTESEAVAILKERGV